MNGIKNLLHDIFLLKSTRAFKKRTRSFQEKHTCFCPKARVLFSGYIVMTGCNHNEIADKRIPIRYSIYVSS